jgi:hypothetical protein
MAEQEKQRQMDSRRRMFAMQEVGGRGVAMVPGLPGVAPPVLPPMPRAISDSHLAVCSHRFMHLISALGAVGV